MAMEKINEKTEPQRSTPPGDKILIVNSTWWEETEDDSILIDIDTQTLT